MGIPQLRSLSCKEINGHDLYSFVNLCTLAVDENERYVGTHSSALRAIQALRHDACQQVATPFLAGADGEKDVPEGVPHRPQQRRQAPRPHHHVQQRDVVLVHEPPVVLQPAAALQGLHTPRGATNIAGTPPRGGGSGLIGADALGACLCAKHPHRVKRTRSGTIWQRIPAMPIDG